MRSWEYDIRSRRYIREDGLLLVEEEYKRLTPVELDLLPGPRVLEHRNCKDGLRGVNLRVYLDKRGYQSCRSCGAPREEARCSYCLTVGT